MTKGFRKQKRAMKLQRETKETPVKPTVRDMFYFATRAMVWSVLSGVYKTEHERLIELIEPDLFIFREQMWVWRAIRNLYQRDRNAINKDSVLEEVKTFASGCDLTTAERLLNDNAPNAGVAPIHTFYIAEIFLRLSERVRVDISIEHMRALLDNFDNLEENIVEPVTIIVKDMLRSLKVNLYNPAANKTAATIEVSRLIYIMDLKSLPYSEYLQTEHWKRIRTTALDRAKNRCQVCNTSIGLHVHHRTYENRGDEQPEDVTVLCATCHKLFHDNRKVEAA